MKKNNVKVIKAESNYQLKCMLVSSLKLHLLAAKLRTRAKSRLRGLINAETNILQVLLD